MPWDGGWHMGWMALWWVLGISLVLPLVWALVTRGSLSETDSGDSPEQILKSRYTKGEIDRVTYVRMLGDLKR